MIPSKTYVVLYIINIVLFYSRYECLLYITCIIFFFTKLHEMFVCVKICLEPVLWLTTTSDIKVNLHQRHLFSIIPCWPSRFYNNRSLKKEVFISVQSPSKVHFGGFRFGSISVVLNLFHPSAPLTLFQPHRPPPFHKKPRWWVFARFT